MGYSPVDTVVVELFFSLLLLQASVFYCEELNSSSRSHFREQQVASGAETKRNETKRKKKTKHNLGSNFKSGKARLSVRGEEKLKESARDWMMGLFFLFFSVLLLGCVIHKYRETRRRCVLGARFIQARNTHTHADTHKHQCSSRRSGEGGASIRVSALGSSSSVFLEPPTPTPPSLSGGTPAQRVEE